MGETTRKVRREMTMLGSHSQTGLGLIAIAEGIDNLNDLIKNSHESQTQQKPASESLEAKKAKALMIVIEKMITIYKLEYAGSRNDIFKLFEKAKAVNRAKTETDFQSAVADL